MKSCTHKIKENSNQYEKIMVLKFSGAYFANFIYNDGKIVDINISDPVNVEKLFQPSCGRELVFCYETNCTSGSYGFDICIEARAKATNKTEMLHFQYDLNNPEPGDPELYIKDKILD